MDDLWQAMERAAAAGLAYRQDLAVAERAPVASPATMNAAFDLPTPETPMAGDAVIGDLIARAGPGLRGMAHPRFFGWVIGNSHPVGVAADWLTGAWGQNAANATGTPAAAACEAVTARWLLDLLGLPAESSVGFVTGATVANFTCLAAARTAVLTRAGWDVESDGLFGAPPITVLIGADAHATVFSGLKYLGLGAKRVVTVATDAVGRILPAAFEAAVAAARGPTIAILQAGQINTGASDPFAELVPIARAAGAWTHVDGAFGLWAQAAPDRRHLTAGVEGCDSWATDGHKWLQTPYDSAYAIVRDADTHRRAMAISASYLPPAAADERDPSAYVPELSRRARGFATWAMIRHLGRSGIAEMVERSCRCAARIGDALAGEPSVAIVAPVALNQVILRFDDDDDATLATIRAVQDDAVAFVGPSLWRDTWVMRVSVSSSATTEADADIAAEAIATAWRRVRAG